MQTINFGSKPSPVFGVLSASWTFDVVEAYAPELLFELLFELPDELFFELLVFDPLALLVPELVLVLPPELPLSMIRF